MGRRGPLKKPQERAQGHRPHTGTSLTVIPGKAVDAPEPPKGLLKSSREAWDAYWQSDVAQVAQEVDMPAIRRLFEAYDQYERAMKITKTALAVKGSTGQIRVNPVAEYAMKLDTQILRLENELGLTPMARQRLGIAVGQAQLTLAQINKMAQEDVDDGDDPRLEIIEVS